MARWSDIRGPRGEAALGPLLEGVLANLDLRGRFREQLAVMAWPQIAGKLVAAHSQAEAVRDGVLIVAADTPAWAQELQMRQRELLDLVARHVGAGVVREIHFRAGKRRGAEPKARPRQTRPAEVKLSSRQQRQIAEAAAKIEDESLRQRAERALSSLARMSEWRRQAGWRQCKRCGQWQRAGRRWCASCTRTARAGRGLRWGRRRT